MNPTTGGDVFIFPTSSGQRRLWLLDQLLPDSALYNIGWRLELDGPLRADALRRALHAVVARHEALRTTFTAVDGVPLQRVGPPSALPVPIVDLAGTPQDVDAVVRLEVRTPFDLADGPLLRARLLCTGPERHVLVLVVHHSVADGWSCGILFDELAAAYQAEVSGVPVDFDELPIQYPDYAVWQREQVESGAFVAQQRYWVEQLAGAPPVLALPTDRIRPAVPTGAGAEHHGRIDPAVLAAARRLAEASSGTLFGTLLAVFQAVLHRLSGQDDLLVGTPVSGRSQAETERLVGFFVNTLPLRARIDPGTTFAELQESARQAVAGALTNQDVPFELLVDALAPQRSLAHAPLVQVLFAVEEQPAPRTAGGVRITPELQDNGGSKFDLSLAVEHTAAGPRTRWQYNTELFDAGTVTAFDRMFSTALSAAVADPGCRVAELPLLTNGEPAPPAGPPAVSSLGTAGQLVDAAIRAADPGRTAVVGTDTSLSYGELDAAANRLAHVLLANGVGPDVPVGLCLERGAGVVVAILVVWRAGGCYLPLDPSWPAERLRTMAADAGIGVLLTDPGAAGRVANELTGPWRTVNVAEVAATPDGPPATPAASPEQLAYLLYTSGSTGAPKGVGVTAGGLTNLLAAMDRLLDLRPDDRFASITTPSFDISVVELLVPLLRGATVLIAAAGQVADGHELRRWLAAEDATVVQGVPAVWRLLAAAGGVPGRVRLRITGGEALTRQLADELLSDGATLINGYGPTETTVYSAAGPVPAGPAPILLGSAVDGTTLHVLDPAMRPVPAGVVGELYVGGAGVARGYHGRPALTAERFVPDPFTTTPGARLYATGDLVRRRPAGLEFLGRADSQVKVRGFRIELGEIESVLRRHDQVADAVVTTWRSGEDDVRLVGYVVPADPRLDVAGLRPWLATRLPEYMVPATFSVLDALPTTATGKIDRSALPAPQWSDTGPAVQPRTDLEWRLAAVWREVLRLPDTTPVGVHDNFFALGGHSLTATQLLARVRSTFGAELSLLALFSAPTIAEFAVAVAAAMETTDAPASRPRTLIDQFDELSDAEVDRLLATMIDEDRV